MFEIKLRNGDGIFVSDIFRVADEFVEQLPSERDPSEPEVFSGLINHINAELFSGENRPDYDDLQGLNRIWTAYLKLCSKCKQVPTMLEFSCLIGCDRDTLRKWENGSIRASDVERIRTVKRWKTMAESGLARKTIASNSVGGMFALKACYGWNDSPVPAEQPEQIVKRDSIEEIMARHQGAALPPKPELD